MPKKVEKPILIIRDQNVFKEEKQLTMEVRRMRNQRDIDLSNKVAEHSASLRTHIREGLNKFEKTNQENFLLISNQLKT